MAGKTITVRIMARQQSQTDDPGLISGPSCIKAPGRHPRELRVPENVYSETPIHNIPNRVQVYRRYILGESEKNAYHSRNRVQLVKPAQNPESVQFYSSKGQQQSSIETRNKKTKGSSWQQREWI